jgi:hypothetical protein
LPVTIETREPSAEERAVIAQRVAIRRGGAASAAGAGDAVWMGPAFGAAGVGAAIWLVMAPSVPAGIALAMTTIFSGFGFWGERLAVQRKARALAEIDRIEANLLRAVTEYRIETDRIVVVSELAGDYETFWFFRDAADRTWLLIKNGQWWDLEASARAWSRDLRIAVDGERHVVSIASSGPRVFVERRDLQPPDHVPAPDTLFWARPADLGPTPAVVRDDPTAPSLAPNEDGGPDAHP